MYFPSTHWTLLAKASLAGDTEGQSALDQLYRRYWQPIRGFIRMRGFTHTEAEDLTQKFLMHLVEHDALQRADRTRGKFRTFLLGALTKFLCDERDRSLAAKRGGRVAHVSVEGDLTDVVSPNPLDAGFFDREWAITALENALARLGDEFKREGKRLDVLRRFLPGAVEVLPYEQAATQLGISLAALKTDVHRVRQRFKAMVREEVAATVSAPHEIDDEMDYLHRVLRDHGCALA